jgi:spermidine/putrescine transport system ATP-binding protein
MGAPEALYDRPRTAFVARFLGQSNIFVGDVTSSTDSAVTIAVNGKQIAVPRARTEKSEGKIAVGVRPEKVTFHESEPQLSGDYNTLGPGEIIDIRFTGVSNQYMIDIPKFGDVTVFAQNVGKSPVVELGAEVWISWKVEHGFGLADLPAKADNDDEE